MTLTASDEESGVHKLGYTLLMKDSGKILREGTVTGNTNNVTKLTNYLISRYIGQSGG